MGTLNYTTSIPASRTIGEMQGMLAKHGAVAVTVIYSGARATGLGFTLATPHGARSFSLPVDVDAVHRLLVKQESTQSLAAARRKAKGTYSSPEHAERVAWRIMKDWLEAQLAIVEAQMARLDQVMLPGLHVDGDRTLYEAYQEREQSLAQITTGEDS